MTLAVPLIRPTNAVEEKLCLLFSQASTIAVRPTSSVIRNRIWLSYKYSVYQPKGDNRT